MNIPQFNAEASLGPSVGMYRGRAPFGRFASEVSGGVMPQFRFRFQSQSDPDLGAYWRCRANGGSDLICRFFGGLPPFTIGGLRTVSRRPGARMKPQEDSTHATVGPIDIIWGDPCKCICWGDRCLCNEACE